MRFNEDRFCWKWTSGLSATWGGEQSAGFLFELEQNRSWLCVVFHSVLRTVRPLGADGPPPVVSDVVRRLNSGRSVLGVRQFAGYFQI